MNLIVTAFPHEYKLVESLMERVQKVSSFEAKCSRQNQYYYLLNAGQGKENCLKSLDRVFQGEKRIQQVLVIGFCGALNPKLQIGDIVYPTEVYLESGEKIETSAGDSGAMLLTVESAVSTQQCKQRLFENTNCDAVDMESFYIIQECRIKRMLPVQVIKSVMDDARTDLPKKNSATDPQFQVFLNTLKEITPQLKKYLEDSIL